VGERERDREREGDRQPEKEREGSEGERERERERESLREREEKQCCYALIRLVQSTAREAAAAGCMQRPTTRGTRGAHRWRVR
jgi:hypothetical protein